VGWVEPVLKSVKKGRFFTNACSNLQIFKGSLTRDFRLQVFFMKQCPPGPQVFHWSLFEMFSKIRGDIRELMFITGVNDTSEKFINDTADKFFGA
jgi:hypothetical protein